jgi:threonine aldolase
MKNLKEENNRRNFLKKCGLSTVPLLLPTIGLNAMPFSEAHNEPLINPQIPVNFIYDGLAFTPQEYLEKLNEINQVKPILPDFYGNGGITKTLEDEFAKITGKEKAIYLPTGTMANQLAIKLLNGENTKVIVPENSHVFRDEADAAQSVHHKRLIPLMNIDKPYFELDDLKEIIDYTNKNEVFKSGLGTVVIENPIRRADGTAVPIETIKEISDYCKQNGYKMHLDGARIHLASAYTGVSILEYASYFDTIYISLYKYLNATGGAILCGDAKRIEQITHQIKIHGGTVFQNWNNTAVASHYLNGINERWSMVLQSANIIVSALNKIDGLSLSGIKNGTNIYDLKLSKEINPKELATVLYDKYNIRLRRANEQGLVKFAINESILTRDPSEIVDAWVSAVKQIRK